MDWQFVYRNEFRLDLKRVNFILIPVLLEVPKLVISIDAIQTKRSSGVIKQLLYDLPYKPVVDSTVLGFGYQVVTFQYSGKYQLQFAPYYSLGRCVLSIYTLPIEISGTTEQMIETLQTEVLRIEKKVDDLSNYG